MSWLEDLRHKVRIARALNGRRNYPIELPNPRLATISARQKAKIDGLKTICLFLGPYRNLTTLTASVLFLHPECQVLNHAGSRVLTNTDMNFLTEYSEQKFFQFCNFAITMSQGGRRGGYGGSIVLSHAFAKHPSMQALFKRRYGSNLLKRDIKCLVWKESERVSQFIRDNDIDLVNLVSKNSRLRFLLPIRNPLDCSLSILKIGISKFYPSLKDDQLGAVQDSILEELHWFMKLSAQYPEHFFYFFQDGVTARTLEDLGRFLGLSEDRRWIREGLSVYKLKPSYEYDVETKNRYLDKVQEVFEDFPAVQRTLMKMASSNDLS